MSKTIKVKLVHSPIGCIPKHRQTLVGLGLRRLQQERELQDTPQVRGMVAQVSHLVRVLGDETKKKMKEART